VLEDYPALLLCLIVGGIVGILVLGYLATNNKLKPPLLKPAKAIYYTFSLGVLLLIVGAVVSGVIEESGWIPRTREISVYLRVTDWMTGEIKTCISAATKEKQELEVLACVDDDTSSEHHTLPVKFWGPITTERRKEWKCVREPASLNCKLQ
jgi:hypothetical protein